MKSNFSNKTLGWFFVLAGVMLWVGWTLLPVRLGVFFEVDDFSAINQQWHLWVWLMRVHIFGFLMAVMALSALAAVVTESEARVLVWPAVAVSMSGLIVGALAVAFYYHHGAWGALELDGKSTDAIGEHIALLRLDTEYVTCLVRFGRVFFGLGQIVLAAAIWKWAIFPRPIAIGAAVLGAAAMALTMGLPDEMDYFIPVFQLNCLWMLAFGVVSIRAGGD